MVPRDDEVRRSRVRARLGRIAIDVSPLRSSRDFRRLWLGHLVSGLGYQFTLVATFVQVFDLTGSAAAVGLIGLVALAASVLATIGGSTFIDAVDRRITLLVTQLGFMLASGGLFLGALAGEPPLWIVYACIGAIAGLSSIESSVRHAMTPRLVGRELLPAALTLNQVVYNSTALLGPAVAGVMIERVGLEWAYGVDMVSYTAMLLVAFTIRPIPPETAEGPPLGWTAVRQGFAFLRGRRVLQGAFTADLVAMVFGMPRALFPILALTQFDRGVEVVGLLFSAPAVGALLGALTGGWAGRVEHQGRAVLWAVAAWGAGIAAFGLAGSELWLALFFLAIAGAADVVSAVFRGTILQLAVPDSLRGRLSGINYLVVAGGPRLGDLEAGLVASALSPTVSVVSGGVLCIAGAALVAWFMPALRTYRAGDPT